MISAFDIFKLGMVPPVRIPWGHECRKKFIVGWKVAVTATSHIVVDLYGSLSRRQGDATDVAIIMGLAGTVRRMLSLMRSLHL